jgi:hypothetical protein
VRVDSRIPTFVACAVAAAALAPAALAKPANGGFEQGTFAEWSHQNSGSKWKLYENDNRHLGTSLGGATLPKTLGEHSAALVQTDPGHGVLYRSLTVPRQATAITMSAFWINDGDEWAFDGAFDEGGIGAVQYFSIDLLKPNADPLSGDKDDVLETVFRPRDSTPFNSGGWKDFRVAAKPFRGDKVLLRLAEADNRGHQNIGLDQLKLRLRR